MISVYIFRQHIAGLRLTRECPASLRYAQLRDLIASDPFTRFAEAAKRAPGSGGSAMIAHRE